MSPADARDGGSDPQVVRKAVEQFERPLLAYALRIVGDADRARDVVQETFARLCREPLGGADVNGHLPQWLYTVCRNAALDARRKEKRTMPMLETAVAEAVPSNQPSPDESAEIKDSTSHALRLLSRLSNDQQEAIRLKFQHGMSYRQISAITGHSESNVGFLIHSGIKSIRSRMNA
jgi:RNA polymerase sigma-70 factor (ECF subfamily)